jgi:hypothetical protein
MSETAYTLEQQKNLEKEQNALARVFKGEDGKLIYDRIARQRDSHIISALSESDNSNKVSHIDRAAGIDSVLVIIDEALKESERRESQKTI